MKYLIVIVLAVVNFAIQAEDQSSVDKQMLSMSFSVTPEVGGSLDTVSLASVDAGIGSEGSPERSFAPVDGSYTGTAASSPAFIWIFGSLVAGLFALASSRLVKSQRQ